MCAVRKKRIYVKILLFSKLNRIFSSYFFNEACHENRIRKFNFHFRCVSSKVKQLVLKMIDEAKIENPIKQESLAWVILMGIEHEKIHLETSAVIISQVRFFDTF